MNEILSELDRLRDATDRARRTAGSLPGEPLNSTDEVLSGLSSYFDALEERIARIEDLVEELRARSHAENRHG